MHRADRKKRRLPAWAVGLILAILIFATVLLIANLLGYGDQPTIGT